jgi:PAS domain S-box-containing protein
MRHNSVSQFGKKSSATQYAFGLLTAMVALLAREMLSPLLGASNPYHTVWAGVVFSAWYCGLGPSIATTLVSVLGVWYRFLPPFNSFAFENPRAEISGMVGFLILSGFIIALGETNRRSKERSARELEERLSTERELKETEVELQNAQRLARTGSWKFDSQTRSFLWSEEMYRMHGRNSALPAPGFEELPTLFAPESWQKLEAAFTRALQSGEGFELELEERGTDGNPMWTITRAEAEREPSGRVQAIRGATQDITERKRLEDALRVAHAEMESRVEERTAELNAANRSLSKFSARLLTLQDEERRRLARELHDSVGQILAAIKMDIALVQSTPLDPTAVRVLAETVELTEQISTEIRTMSYLLHPPLLDEVGLASALKLYVEGFSERSRIVVELDISGKLGRMEDDREIAIFRIVQECLTNVHRHSGSRTVAVRLARTDDRVRIEVKDDGKGIPLEKQLALSSAGQLGVGFRGMRERISQLGGALEVESDDHGTLVRATLPLPD